MKLVVIGASAGALSAISSILSALPADFASAIAIVVHLPADKDSALPMLLQSKSKLIVKEAEDKEPIQAGTVYFAPPDYHLLVEKSHSFSLSSEEPVFFSRPSIDVLFETAAEAYENNIVGIILTGANSDGAMGLKAVSDQGGIAIVQNPLTSYATAMPEAAIQQCPNATILDIERIAPYLEKVILT